MGIIVHFAGKCEEFGANHRISNEIGNLSYWFALMKIPFKIIIIAIHYIHTREYYPIVMIITYSLFVNLAYRFEIFVKWLMCLNESLKKPCIFCHFSFVQKISGRLRCLYLSCCRFLDQSAVTLIANLCPQLEGIKSRWNWYLYMTIRSRLNTRLWTSWLT